MSSASGQRPLPPDDDPAARAHNPVSSAQVWALRAAFATMGRLAPEVAARWAETLFCRPPRHQPRPRDYAFLAKGRPYTLVKGDQQIGRFAEALRAELAAVHAATAAPTRLS